jgi:hypothetical protein
MSLWPHFHFALYVCYLYNVLKRNQSAWSNRGKRTGTRDVYTYSHATYLTRNKKCSRLRPLLLKILAFIFKVPCLTLLLYPSFLSHHVTQRHLCWHSRRLYSLTTLRWTEFRRFPAQLVREAVDGMVHLDWKPYYCDWHRLFHPPRGSFPPHTLQTKD